MSGTADHLLRLIQDWTKEARECSSNLRALADELETLRRDCNIAGTVGTTVAVVGGVAVAAAPFTGGASLAVGGAVVGAVGAGVSLGTSITEHFLSNGKLERVKQIDEKCSKIAAKIKQLFQKLRDECPSVNKDERDQHVVKEFITAMMRRSGQSPREIIARIQSIKHMHNALVMDVLSVFSLRMEGVLLAMAAAAGKQLGKVAIAGEAMAIGRVTGKFLGVVGLALTLPEAIQNWTEAIQNNHETEASRSLREMAQKIMRAVKALLEAIALIEEMLAEDSSSEDEQELNMALVNARSAHKFIKPRDRALIDLIQNNDLDVLLISETWFLVDSVQNIRSILPRNCDIIHNPRFYGRGGGVAIVYKNTHTCAPVTFDTSTFEVVAATVTPPGSADTFLILCVYRPPGGSATEVSREFLTELRMFLIDVNRSGIQNVIIGGDFNIWVDRPDLATTREFLGILTGSGFVQHVLQPTHRKGHILDLVLSKPTVRVSGVSVQPNVFSDHHTVFFKTRFKENLVRSMKKLTVQKSSAKKNPQGNYRY